MVPFSMNRWWRFILTLCLLTASFCLLEMLAPVAALADSGSLLVPTEPVSSGGNVGDPDVPMGPGDGKTSWACKRIGRVDRGMSVHETRRAGDAVVTDSVVMNHLRLLLLSVRGISFGF